MRNRRFGAQSSRSRFMNQQDLPAAPCDLRRLEQALRMRHSFEDTRDGMTGWFVRQISDQIRDIDIGLVARGEGVTDRYAAFDRLGQGLRQGAGLTGNADGLAGQVARRRIIGKGDARAAHIIGNPQTIGSQNLQSGVEPDAFKAALKIDSLRQLSLGVAGGVQNNPSDAQLRGLPHDIFDGIARRDHSHAVRILWQRRHRWVAAPIADQVVLGVHQVNVAAETGKIRQYPVAEGAGLGRGADNADMPRVENAVQLRMPINRPRRCGGFHLGCLRRNIWRYCTTWTY